MADAVTSQVLVDEAARAVMKFTNISDGTGETAVTKVDVSALAGAPSEVSIDRVMFICEGLGLNVLWDADSDQVALALPSGGTEMLEFDDFGGIPNNAGAGKTGDIKFTTVGADSGDRYMVILWLRKA